jgi:hypothetical protein
MVSESLHGVVCQRLVPSLDGRRAPALEILVGTPAVANLIRENKLFQLRGVMQTGRAQGMRTLDDSLRELVAAGRIDPEEARRVLEAASSTMPQPAAVAPPPAPVTAEPEPETLLVPSPSTLAEMPPMAAAAAIPLGRLRRARS